jgi:hypothetical protein
MWGGQRGFRATLSRSGLQSPLSSAQSRVKRDLLTQASRRDLAALLLALDVPQACHRSSRFSLAWRWPQHPALVRSLVLSRRYSRSCLVRSGASVSSALQQHAGPGAPGLRSWRFRAAGIRTFYDGMSLVDSDGSTIFPRRRGPILLAHAGELRHEMLANRGAVLPTVSCRARAVTTPVLRWVRASPRAFRLIGDELAVHAERHHGDYSGQRPSGTQRQSRLLQSSGLGYLAVH